MLKQLKVIMRITLSLCLILILGACSVGSDEQDKSTDQEMEESLHLV